MSGRRDIFSASRKKARVAIMDLRPGCAIRAMAMAAVAVISRPTLEESRMTSLRHVMDGYKFLMQNYNVGDKVCLFGSSHAKSGPDGNRPTCGFVARFLSWCVHRPSARRDVAQSTRHYRVFHLFLIPIRLAV